MKQSRTTIFYKRILRRTTACILALAGIWMLSFTIPAATPFQWLKAWGGNAQLVTAALAAQLSASPTDPNEGQTRSPWQRILLSESALLSGWNQSDKSDDSELSAKPENENAETPINQAESGTIVEQFFQATDSAGYAKVDDVYILNRTSKTLDMAALAATPLDINLGPNTEPQILIIHTHATEAYAQDGSDVYNESGTARTTDPNYNIIRVGDEIERIFTEMGLSVLHDRTLYDYPSYNGSYDRSKVGVEQYLKDYPSIKIVLDIHRDALVGNDGTVYKAVTEIDNNKTAQILLVMGSDDGGLPHPNWQKNLLLAMRIQHRMDTLWPGLARPITLRSSRFNQQLTNGSLLVEVGSHGNTLQEALAGARLFARSAGQVFQELKP
jgi:stage II sporulation protein P